MGIASGGNNQGQLTSANSISIVVASDQAAIPVSGTVAVTGALTDTQLRASTVVVSDILTGSGTQGAVSVTSSATAIQVGGSPLTSRKNLFAVNNGTATIFWGLTNAVTTSTGIPWLVGQALTGDWGPGTTIYAIATSGTHNVRVVESA